MWRGADSNRIERLQAANFADQLKLEHGYPDIETGTAAQQFSIVSQFWCWAVLLDDGEEAGEEAAMLDSVLPLAAKSELAEAAAAPDEQPGAARAKLRLYRCSDDSGKLVLTEVKEGPLVQADLHSDDSFLIDNGNYGIWVWIGRRASTAERREAMRNAQVLIFGFLN